MQGLWAEELDLRTPWIAGLLVLALLLVAVQIGFLAGRRARKRDKSEGGAELGIIQGAVLGLLGLLLAFTYSFVASRYDARRQAVVQEANALGTSWLRAGLLPEPGRSELRQALRDYLRSRLVADEVFSDPKRLAAAIAGSERLQARLWPTAVKRLEGRPSTPADALLLQSLNELIDLHAVRLAAGRDRLPGPILFMVGLVAVISVGVTGFTAGLNDRRNVVLTTTLAVLIAAVTFVILDLDRPRGGLIRVSQRSLIELQQSLEAAADPATTTASAR